VSSQASNVTTATRQDLSFETLVEAHYAALFRFAMSLTRSETDASDLVQETFLTWAEKGHQLEDAAKAKGWLFTTLHRIFLGARRRSQRFPEVELEEFAEEFFSPEPDLVRRMEGAELFELLGGVDEQYRTAVGLFYLEDYSYEEIGGILGVPLGTVKSRIARGVGQLKALVARQQKGERT
jgi:RNA polymerase sigma-70 factor (ECF subfamily)